MIAAEADSSLSADFQRLFCGAWIFQLNPMMCEVAEQEARLLNEADKEAMPNKQEIHVAASSGNPTSLLELAADNDLAGFKQAVEKGAKVDEPGHWYCRSFGTNKMSLEQRTAVMIASVYGSVEVLGFIMSHVPGSEGLINQVCGSDQTTPLHCAASGGAFRVVEIMGLLLDKGACCDARDALGRLPVDVLTVNPKLPHVKVSLENMLSKKKLGRSDIPKTRLKVQTFDSETASGLAIQDKSLEELMPGFVKSDGFTSTPTTQSLSSPDSSSPLFSPSPSSPKSSDGQSPKFSEGNEKGREYPLDACLPDIKNSIYTTDEFRMYSFKVRPCSRAYSHDWTECPFVHPGENARRRDPRRYHYSCVPCPDFRKGACRRGDACEYAHGVFECWLHPAQYRTRLCKDGTSCARRVCFFAHTTEELRPLYALSSAVQSPRDSSPLELRTIGSPPLPCLSPSPMLTATGPFSPCNASVSTPPMSPSTSLNTSYGGPWPQPGMPTLHLPSGLHASRLRAASNARDMLNECSELDHVAMEFASLSAHSGRSPQISGAGSNNFGRIGKYGNLGLSIPPTNLQEVFASEHISPVSASHPNSFQDRPGMSPQLHSYQAQMQLLNSLLSPRSAQTSSQFQGSHSLMPSSTRTPFNSSSPRPMSSHRVELDVLGASSVPVSPNMAPSLQSRKAAFALRDGGSWSSRDLSGSVPSLAWSDWGSPSGKPDWGVQGHDLGAKFQKSASFASHGATEPDVSWVQSLVKDSPGDLGGSG